MSVTIFSAHEIAVRHIDAEDPAGLWGSAASAE